MITVLFNRNANSIRRISHADVETLLVPFGERLHIYDISEGSTLSEHELLELIDEATNEGNSKFVATGGDGTFNALLNAIMTYSLLSGTSPDQFSLGMIPAGSSNDICKNRYGQVRPRINFAAHRTHTIGSFYTDRNKVQQFFTANASVGIIANASQRYNQRNGLLRYISRLSSELVMTSVGIRELLSYQDQLFDLVVDDEQLAFSLTSFGISRYPYFAGRFHYPGRAASHGFNCYLSHSLDHYERLQTLYALRHGRFPQNHHHRRMHCQQVGLSSPEAFAFEADGETTVANEVLVTQQEGPSICPLI